MKRSKITASLLTVVGGIALVGALFVLAQSGGSMPGGVPAAAPATPAGAPRPAELAAVVDGEPITRADWERAASIDRALSALAGQAAPDAEATLERLINERLVLRQAAIDAPAIGAAQAEDRLAQLMRAWGVDEPGLQQTLASAGLSRADVLNEIGRLLQVEGRLNQIAAAQDAEAWLASLHAQAKIEVHADLAALASVPTSAAPLPEPTPEPVLPIGVQLGQQAPDFALSDLDGAELRLSELRGRPVIVNFWATWCPPCRVEAPALQAAFEQYREQGVVLLGIDQREDAATVRQFASEFGLTYPLLLDSDGAISALYQVLGIPTTVFLDARGAVVARHVGPLSAEQVGQYLEPVLEASAPSAAGLTSTSTAQDFALPRETGETVRLSDYRDKSSIVLVFYRGST